MAILIAHYDERRDFLDNFEPFVLDRLDAWPVDQPVRPKELSAAMSDAFSLPPIPINTVTELRNRAKREGYLRRRYDNNYYPDKKKLTSVRDVRAGRTEVLAHLEALNAALRRYVKERFDQDWSDEAAERALEAFATEFGIELASAQRDGDVAGSHAADRNGDLAVVHSFARHALRHDADCFSHLEEMVKGSMLTNVLYFNDLGSWTPKIDNLVVFLDTPIALRLLGLAPEELTTGARQLMELLEAFEVPVRVFDHTLIEMVGVLEGVKANLERARRQELDVRTLVNLNREVIEYLIRIGWGPGDVQSVITNIEQKLRDAGVPVEPVPDYSNRSLSINEGALEERLLASKFTRSQVAMDVKSIAAIHRLRGGRPALSLGKARAVFVTSNRGLVRQSNRFFQAENSQSPVGHCMSDLSLTTQLWLVGPDKSKAVPRKVLIAESFAALNPPREVWKRYLEKVEAKRLAGEVTEEEVKTLVFSSLAQEGLLEVTHGDPRAVSDDTPSVVLERYKEATVETGTRDLTERFERDRGTLEAENERLRADAETSRNRLDRQDVELREQRDELEALRQGLRRAGGFALAALALAGGAALLVAEVVSGPLGIATVGFVAALVAAVGSGWGLGKPLTWSVDALIRLGAFLAIFFGLFGLAQGLAGP
jgi:hypothetical protein